MAIFGLPTDGDVKSAIRALIPGRIDAVTGAAPSTNFYTNGYLDNPSGIPPVYQDDAIVGRIAPGTSSAARSIRAIGRKVSGFISDIPNPSAKSYLNWTDGAGNPIGSGGGSGFSVAAPVSDRYDYFNAPLASRYKMNAETAYQEALANTAYQRAVEDLKAAGLNPVLAAGKVSGADSFYGRLDSGASGGYSGGSRGFSGGRSYSSSSSGRGLFSAALKDYNVRNGISAVASGIVSAKTGGNFQAGAATYFFSNAILNAASKFL